MTISILYGVDDNKRDVTEICLSKLMQNGIITIPKDDCIRANFFDDHLPGIEKYIYIVINEIEYVYNQLNAIKINMTDLTLEVQNDTEIDDKINLIHNNLKIKYGNIKDELPEQKMVVRYFTGNEKVLEIGGNIGRNSLVIASIVNNDNFVTLESDSYIAKQLEENRNINNFTFHIENVALSKRMLIQKDWTTKPSNFLEDGYKYVNITSFEGLKSKYKINFDTLVLDCEGAFYYILMDMPEILADIKLIIMENDYYDITHKNFIDHVLKTNNFYTDYIEGGGWGPCTNNFFEVWKKADT